VDQELLTLPQHMSYSPIFSWVSQLKHVIYYRKIAWRAWWSFFIIEDINTKENEQKENNVL
jgi:hypothetical protein